MSVDAFGGWVERSAVLCFNTLFLFSLVRAYAYLRSGEMVLQRRWMLRAVAILLGIATTRPVMALFFATSRLTHLEPRQFFGWAFWIGFSINTLVVEWWLHSDAIARTRPRTLRTRSLIDYQKCDWHNSVAAVGIKLVSSGHFRRTLVRYRR